MRAQAFGEGTDRGQAQGIPQWGGIRAAQAGASGSTGILKMLAPWGRGKGVVRKRGG